MWYLLFRWGWGVWLGSYCKMGETQVTEKQYIFGSRHYPKPKVTYLPCYWHFVI